MCQDENASGVKESKCGFVAVFLRSFDHGSFGCYGRGCMSTRISLRAIAFKHLMAFAHLPKLMSEASLASSLVVTRSVKSDYSDKWRVP